MPKHMNEALEIELIQSRLKKLEEAVFGHAELQKAVDKFVAPILDEPEKPKSKKKKKADE